MVYASTASECFFKWELLPKERIFSPSKFIPLQVAPYQKGDKYAVSERSSLEDYPFNVMLRSKLY